MSPVGVLLVFILASLTGDGRAAGDAEPITLATTSHPIVAFAQDGDRLAWVGHVGTACGEPGFPSTAVYVSTPSTGEVQRLVDAFCSWEGRSELALAGRRALWTEHWAGNSTYTEVLTAEAGRPPVRLQQPYSGTRTMIGDPDGSGTYFGVPTGDRDLLVDSVRSAGYGACDPYEERCELLEGGDVRRVDGRRARTVPGFRDVVAVVALAAAAPNVATVAAGAAAGKTVVVQNARTGEVVTSFDPAGVAREIALTPALVAVLVDRGRVRRIELRDAASGRLRRSVPVPSRARSLAAGGRVVVFSAGPHVYTLDPRTFRVHSVARTAQAPIGLSVEGTRIAWAENVGGRGRVRAVTVS